MRACGMEPVLGDGLGSEVQSWLEACVARSTIRNAGEFNGFLKPKDRLLEPPLPFANGAIHMPRATGLRSTAQRSRNSRLQSLNSVSNMDA